MAGPVEVTGRGVGFGVGLGVGLGVGALTGALTGVGVGLAVGLGVVTGDPLQPQVEQDGTQQVISLTLLSFLMTKSMSRSQDDSPSLRLWNRQEPTCGAIMLRQEL